MVIRETGNVGIGTTSPEAKLHIRGGGNIDGNIRLDMDYGPGAGWGIPTHFNSIEFYTPDNGTPNTGKVAYRLTHQSYDTHANTLLVLKSTIANGDTESDLMTWKHGNVGIGTTDPKGLLHIYGNSHQDAYSIDYAGLLRLSESSTNGHGHGLWGLINMPDSVAVSYTHLTLPTILLV